MITDGADTDYYQDDKTGSARDAGTGAMYDSVVIDADFLLRFKDRGVISRVYTDKARYDPGDNVTITVECLNTTGADWSGTLYLDIYYLENLIHSDNQPLNLVASGSITKTFSWTTPSEDFKGYYVFVRAGIIDNAAAAIDVSSDWTRYPRYGFLSLYQQDENVEESQTKINKLSQDYHINALQFYD